MPSKQVTPTEILSGLGAAVLDALPNNAYVVDRSFRIVAWNSGREKGPLGRPRSKVLGRPLRERLGAHGYHRTVPLLQRVFDTGIPQEETTETRDAVIYQVRRLPVRAGGRGVTHVLSWFEDITEHLAMEMRLIASDRLAFLGQLVAGVAHEISNPLAGVAGCAEALASLAMRSPEPKTQKEALEFRDLIRGEVARCERLVRSLLDSARPVPDTTADLGSVVGATLRLLERHPAFARVRVVSRLAAGLPLARIDPDSLKQVVIALAMNAARAMPGGGALTLRGSRANGNVLLDVMDTGPGVPPAMRKRIFDPYFTTDPTNGTGLGLAIARSLVRGRGGDLVYRARRSGAAFRVELKEVEGPA